MYRTILVLLLAAAVPAMVRAGPGVARGKPRKSPAALMRAGGRAEPTGAVIIQFKRGVSRVDAVALLSASGAAEVKLVPRHANRFLVRYASGDGVPEKAAGLMNCPLVEWAEADLAGPARPKHVPNDTLFYDQWALRNTGQHGGMTNHDMSADAAWDITRGTQTVVVAVLDDGVEFAHPDLGTNKYINPGEYGDGMETNGVDDDANGYVDDWQGWDFYQGTNSGTPVVELDYHGTWSAGVISAAADNGEGIAGLASRCRLLSIRVVGGGRVKSAQHWADAMEYAASLADVISFGYYVELTPAFHEAINHAITYGRGGKGCVVVAALGNDGIRRRYTLDASAIPEVISVSGASNYDKRSFFSDYGPAVSLVCPAGGGNVDVLTTDRTIYGTNYVYVNGTSMACPLAAAAAALMISEHPDWTGLEVRQALAASCDKIDSAAWPYGDNGRNERYGSGRVNVRAALTDPRPAWDPYEPDNGTNSAAPIADGELQYRSLSTGSDVDWVRIDATNLADISVSALGTTNVALWLYSNATLIASNDAGTYPQLSASNLPAGAYYLEVNSLTASPVSNYGLHLAVINTRDGYENDDTTNAARTVALREMQQRSFYPAGDVDWAKFVLTTNALVDIHTMGLWVSDTWTHGGDTEIWLRDSAGTQIGYSDDIVPGTNRYSEIVTSLGPGDYYVEVREYNNKAFPCYELLMTAYERDEHEPDDSPAQAVPITAGGISGGTIYPSNDVDWLTFTLTNTANVLIMTDSNSRFENVDTELWLYRLENGTNAFVAYNDNGNGTSIPGSFSAIFRTGLSTGVYYVKAGGRTGTEISPNYYVSLDVFEKTTELTGAAPVTNEAALTWTSDATYNYRIECSADLTVTQAWTSVTNVEGRVGRNRWVGEPVADPSPGSGTQSFYRVVVQ